MGVASKFIQHDKTLSGEYSAKEFAPKTHFEKGLGVQKCSEKGVSLYKMAENLQSISRSLYHYENMLLYGKFHSKTEHFQVKNSDIFSYFCSKHRL